MSRKQERTKVNLDYDTNPKDNIPKPILKNRIPLVPELCLTPETKQVKASDDCEALKPEPALDLTPEKCQTRTKKVAFPKSPPQHTNPSLKASRKNLTWFLRDGVSEINTRHPKKDCCRTNSEKTPCAKDPSSTLSFWFSEPTKHPQYIVQDHTTGRNTSNIPKQTRKKETRRAQKKVSLKSRNVIHEPPLTRTSISNLRKPEFNSTLKLARDMMKLKVTNHHAEEIKKLDNENLQHRLLEKAVKKVNIPFEEKLYKDLVPLDVKPIPELKPKYQVPTKEKDPEPDVKDMFSERFYTEFCCQEVNFELPFIDEPAKSSEDTAFVQYRLIRKWEGLPLH